MTEDHVSKYSFWSYLEIQAKKHVGAVWDDLQTFTYKSGKFSKCQGK